MKLFSYIILIAAMAFAIYKTDDKLIRISSEKTTAESVYLTKDNENRPVVVWTERDADRVTLFFSISEDNGQTFTEKRSVSVSPAVATHAEGMPKIAFKKDGTIIAAYESMTPTTENKYASCIYYKMSRDGGTTWSEESFVHSDTVTGRSRSYFDIERLPDGEIGAAWLDIKLNQETGGRSVRFASTTANGGFAHEVLVDSSACQCCRIDVHTDLVSRVNIAYRGLANTLAGKSIRDMMLVTSTDNGKTFTQPIKISQDNWSIDGCPHTGPSLCSSKNGIYSMWYTGGNGTGIYYSFRQNETDRFTGRQLISSFGRHPQVGATDSRFIMVWEENTGKDNLITRICYQTSDGNATKKQILGPDGHNAFLPVVTSTTDGFVVAFLMERGNEVAVYATKISNIVQ